MKVTLISNFEVKNGRGPVFRLIHIIPYINRMVDLNVLVLGELDTYTNKVFKSNKIKFHQIPYNVNGWFVQDINDLVRKIKKYIFQSNSEIAVLEWEIWDLMVALTDGIENCEFVTVIHSIPFVDALPFPQNYWQDFEMRYLTEQNKMIKEYMRLRKSQIDQYIYKMNIISINKTISYYLDNYFRGLQYYESIPGYALDVVKINKYMLKREKLYDFCFMSKLESSKGIFELLEIVNYIVEMNKNSKILIIGDFLYKDEEERFVKEMIKLKLNYNIELSGWLEEEEKYKKLAQCKVFLYPSLTGDTFSFCLLEALACGLSAVSYNTPFIKIIYKEGPVAAIKYKNNKDFADMALHLLEKHSDKIENKSKKFVEENYSDWKAVAESEVNVYERIINKKRND